MELCVNFNQKEDKIAFSSRKTLPLALCTTNWNYIKFTQIRKCGIELHGIEMEVLCQIHLSKQKI